MLNYYFNILKIKYNALDENITSKESFKSDLIDLNDNAVVNM